MKYSIQVRLLRNEDYHEWDRLVGESPGGTVYHQSSWLRAVSSAVRQEVQIYGIFKKDLLVGGATFVVVQRGPVRYGRRPFATPYSGVVLFGSGELVVSDEDLECIYKDLSKSLASQ